MDYAAKCISLKDLSIDRAKFNARQKVIDSINSQIIDNEIDFFENGFILVSISYLVNRNILDSVLEDYKTAGWKVDVNKKSAAMFYEVKLFQ